MDLPQKTYKTRLGEFTQDQLREKLPEIVRDAAEAKKDYITENLELYVQRREKRTVPVLAFLGHGRAGKDEGALWLRANFDVEYSASTSQIVCPLVAHSMGLGEREVFSSRHQDRMFWKDFCNEFRRDDPTILVKMCLARGDVIVGIRGATELDACVAESVIDVSLWIENPRVDPDPTVDFTIDDCDFVLRNATHKFDYYRRLRKLAGMLDFTPRKGHFG